MYNFQRYAKVSGEQDIIVNGTYDVANKEKVNVNIQSVASGGTAYMKCVRLCYRPLS